MDGRIIPDKSFAVTDVTQFVIIILALMLENE
jgi:hypothetical protein